ncbi:MAG: hypothetical protein OEZ02_02930 [Anaerolineae bacterium]|nr:hypothetical protein [Anaerolineae bacterium]
MSTARITLAIGLVAAAVLISLTLAAPGAGLGGAAVAMPAALGALMLILGLFAGVLERALGLPSPRSDLFTDPKLRRAARFTERIGHATLAFGGAGLLLSALGGQLGLPAEQTTQAAMVLIGLAVLGIPAIVLVNLVHWPR